MGKKAKGSRKGKKAWRANISTEDIENYFEKSTKDALSGGPLTSAPAESLFTVDKSQDLSVKRKIEKRREKVLRCDSVLQRNPFVEAVPSSKMNKHKQKKKSVVVAATDAAQDAPKDTSEPDSSLYNIWENKDECDVKARKVAKPPSAIPAVEIEPPGCSFNPTFESHQDSLAQAVAEEMVKQYQIELRPQPVPLLVTGEAIDEEDKYFIEADGGEDEEEEEEDNDNKDEETEKKSSKTKRVTRVVHNKRARNKELQRKEAEAKKFQGPSKEIDSLPDILQEIAKEDEEKQNKRLRRITVKQEKLKNCPPRLGKYKFKPAPHQVLLSEEITGSLRKIKGCVTLARDRFKSYEKRGILVPSARTGRK